MKKIKNFIASKKPHVIAVAGESRQVTCYRFSNPFCAPIISFIIIQKIMGGNFIESMYLK